MPRLSGNVATATAVLRQPYREGQQDQLGTLGLVVNAIALWNTRYMAAALDYLGTLGLVVNAIALWNTRYMAAALDYLGANEGHVRTEDVERLSPLRHGHINLHGRYYSPPPTPSPEADSAAFGRSVLRPVFCSILFQAHTGPPRALDYGECNGCRDSLATRLRPPTTKTSC